MDAVYSTVTTMQAVQLLLSVVLRMVMENIPANFWTLLGLEQNGNFAVSLCFSFVYIRPNMSMFNFVIKIFPFILGVLLSRAASARNWYFLGEVLLLFFPSFIYTFGCFLQIPTVPLQIVIREEICQNRH